MFLTQLQDNQHIEIFRLEQADNHLFGNYQRYDFFQLIWFTEVGGDPMYFLDFREYDLKENQIVLIYPGQLDKLDIRGKKGYLFAIRNETFFELNQRMQSNLLNGYHSNVFLTPDHTTEETLEILMDLLLTEYEDRKRTTAMKIYMEAFLFHVASLFESGFSQLDESDELVARLMRLIDSNFITERETEFYASSLGSTNRRLNAICKKGTGKTVKQHILERLLLEARREIRLSRKSMKEIAFDLGFNEAAYFTRFFKEQTGVTPSEFKDMVYLSK